MEWTYDIYMALRPSEQITVSISMQELLDILFNLSLILFLLSYYAIASLNRGKKHIELQPIFPLLFIRRNRVAPLRPLRIRVYRFFFSARMRREIWFPLRHNFFCFYLSITNFIYGIVSRLFSFTG
jgi:hypothetical protein